MQLLGFSSLEFGSRSLDRGLRRQTQLIFEQLNRLLTILEIHIDLNQLLCLE